MQTSSAAKRLTWVWGWLHQFPMLSPWVHRWKHTKSCDNHEHMCCWSKKNAMQGCKQMLVGKKRLGRAVCIKVCYHECSVMEIKQSWLNSLAPASVKCNSDETELLSLIRFHILIQHSITDKNMLIWLECDWIQEKCVTRTSLWNFKSTLWSMFSSSTANPSSPEKNCVQNRWHSLNVI